MQRKDLALRVLSTAAIMSIVTSIAAPAFADIYYIGNGSIDVKTMTGANGEYVQVTQNGKTYTDTSKEIVIKDGTSEKDATLKEAARAEGTQAKPAVAPAAGAATQEQEAAGSADAAGESQPDPDAGFTLNETQEDSAQTQEGKDTTKKEVRRLRQGDALCQQPVVLRVGRGAVVLAVLRLRHRADLLRARVGRGGIRLVHPHGAQRHLLERVVEAT